MLVCSSIFKAKEVSAKVHCIDEWVTLLGALLFGKSSLLASTDCFSGSSELSVYDSE